MNDIEKVSTALAEIDLVAAGIATLTNRYAGVVYNVADPEGMKEAIAARKAIKAPLFAVEKIRKEGKAPILELGRKLDGDARHITEQLEALVRPIDAQIDAEKAKAEIALQAENQRVAQITQSIVDLNMVAGQMGGKSSAEIVKKMADLTAYELSDWADEFIVQAEKARAGAIAALQQLHAGALAQENMAAMEAERVAQDRAELARLKAEKDERDRNEQARLDDAQARIDREEAASKARIEADERAARQVREEADRIARVTREAEEARLKTERDRVEAEARRVRQAAEEAERAERKRQAELADADAMLKLFVQRYGHMPKFAPLVTWVGKYFNQQKQAA